MSKAKRKLLLVQHKGSAGRLLEIPVEPLIGELEVRGQRIPTKGKLQAKN